MIFDLYKKIVIKTFKINKIIITEYKIFIATNAYVIRIDNLDIKILIQ